MKKVFLPAIRIFMVMCIFITYIHAQNKPGTTTGIQPQGPFLGQTPPSKTPAPFAAESLSIHGSRLHSCTSFTAAGGELFWAVIPPRVMHMKLGENRWSKPRPASFSQRNIQAPVFSPDGNRVYFQMSRQDGHGSLDIWFSARCDTGWSAPVLVDAPPNSNTMEAQPSLTSSGTIYFCGTLEGSGWNRGIYRSEHNDSVYMPAELLPPSINSKYIDAYPFIAPDESFLLFSSSRPHMEESALKLFASWRNSNGAWSEPVSISDYLDITSPVRFACVTPDMKYMFYMSGSTIFWVDAAVLEDARNSM